MSEIVTKPAVQVEEKFAAFKAARTKLRTVRQRVAEAEAQVRAAKEARGRLREEEAALLKVFATLGGEVMVAAGRGGHAHGTFTVDGETILLARNGAGFDYIPLPPPTPVLGTVVV